MMIDSDKLYTYFDRNHGPLSPSTNGWYNGTCPFCGDEKLAFHPGYKQVKCWKGCIKGFAMNLIMRYHGITYFESKEMVDEYDPTYVRVGNVISRGKRSKLVLPPGYTPILSGNSIIADRARSFLSNRGFDLNYLDMIGVGYCDEEHSIPKENYFGYIIIPFKRDGDIVYFIGRAFLGQALRYKNPARETHGVGKSELLFNEGTLNVMDKIYVTEGWADAATLAAAGTSIQGNDMSIYQQTKIISSPVKEVVVVLDAGFYRHGLRVATKLLPHKRVKVLNMDTLKAYGKDVNEVGARAVYDLEAATPYLDRKILYKELLHAT